MKKQPKSVTLQLSTHTVRALQAAQLDDVGGAMRPKITWQVGCNDKTSNCTVLC